MVAVYRPDIGRMLSDQNRVLVLVLLLLLLVLVLVLVLLVRPGLL